MQVPWVWSQLCHNTEIGLWASYSRALWLVKMHSKVSFNLKALLSYPPPILFDIAAWSQLKSSRNLYLLSFKATAKNSGVQMLLGAPPHSPHQEPDRGLPSRLSKTSRTLRSTERQELLSQSDLVFKVQLINSLSWICLLTVWAWVHYLTSLSS